jgi:hypothetical protein
MEEAMRVAFSGQREEQAYFRSTRRKFAHFVEI